MKRLLLILRAIIILCIFSFQSNAQVVANFSGSPLIGCAPLNVQFTDLSTGGPTGWNWNFGNSNASTQQNPSAIYVNPGTYTVVLSVTNGASTNTTTKTAYITVYNKANANFNILKDTVCVGEAATFSDATTINTGGVPITGWSWDFGDGNTQNTSSNSITHPYTTAGTYPVSMIATDANGCTSSIIKNIVVLAKPVANFSATPRFACAAPLTSKFTVSGTVSGTATYLWRFGDGTSSSAASPSHTYSSLGTYSVTLIITQGNCVDSITKTNYISVQSISASLSASDTLACTGQSISFTNTTVPGASTNTWNFGDGGTSTSLTPNHVYNTPGVYTITLISNASSGCSDTVTYTNYITIHQTPVAAFTPVSASVCAFPANISFTNVSVNAFSWNWDFGDGNTSNLQSPTNTYNSVGTNTVTLIVANSTNTCFDTITRPNYITYSPPVANFSTNPDSGCAPLNVTFTDASTSTVSPVATYYWNFGDGTLDTTTTPGNTNVYANPGIYTISYIIQTVNGCRDTIVCTNCIKVGTKPTAIFGVVDDTVCYGLPVIFADSTVGATGWLWQFGDGSTSNVQNPSHIYGQPGTYNAYLIAYNNGCPDTAAILPIVILPPKAIFTATLSCINYYDVVLNSTSIGADSLFWNFGDGSSDSSNTTGLTHTYASRGGYTVTLTAFNYSSGCSHSITVSFTIAEPIASFTQANTSGCYPFSTNYTNTSQDGASFWWNFGDTYSVIDTAIIANPSYTYNKPQQSTVTLIITDVNGCKDTATATTLTLGPTPYFYADTLKGCTPLPVTFIDTSLSDSTIVQWIWNYGDGNIDTTYNDSISHTYTTPGLYTVTMTVKDTNGCIKSITLTNYVAPTFPFPAFTVDTFACRGDSLIFNASATVAAGATYYWDYGDGTKDTTSNPTIGHIYNSDNYYTVALTVVDSNGCDSTIFLNVRIEKPTANFGWTILNSGCGTLQVAFSDSSAQFITSWQWNFGNGASSTLQNPTYTYTAPGVYSVTLIVTNAGGCIDTLRLDSIIVVDGPIGTFTFSPVTGCIPLTVNFIASSNNATQYIWDFGDGTVIPGTNTISHTYTYAGLFNPILILGNILPNGQPCLLPANNLSGSVNSTKVISTTFTPNVITIPEDSIYSVFPSVVGATSPTYNWSPNTGLNCSSCQNVNITGLGGGDTISYYFTVTDTNGCFATDTLIVISPRCIDEKLIPNVFSPNGDGKNDDFYIPGVCASEDYDFKIYDRWGLLMFSTNQSNVRWDGRTVSGALAPDGTYFFIAKVWKRNYKGYVQLVR